MGLDVFIMTDQPETCRQCGMRTDFVDLSTTSQLHRCRNCQFTYLLEDGTIPCINCGSTDELEVIFNDMAAILCRSCKTVFDRDDEIILDDHMDPVAYHGE